MTRPTETDLRAALTERALDHGAEPDVTDLRTRIAALTAAERPSADAEVFDLVTGTSRPSRWARRSTLIGLVAAACAAVVAAAVVIAAVDRSDNTPPAHRAPKSITAFFLPGEQYVTSFHGTGHATLTLPERTLPTHWTWTAYWSCTGSATRFGLHESGWDIDPACHGVPTGGSSFTPVRGQVHLEIGGAHAAQVGWTVWLTIAPELRTNASLVHDSESDLPEATAGTPNFATGTGNGSVTADLSHSAGTVRVQLSCDGDGVTIPGVADPLHGDPQLYTHTCFSGRVYQWNVTSLSGTVTLKVEASATTRWRILVDG